MLHYNEHLTLELEIILNIQNKLIKQQIIIIIMTFLQTKLSLKKGWLRSKHFISQFLVEIEKQQTMQMKITDINKLINLLLIVTGLLMSQMIDS